MKRPFKQRIKAGSPPKPSGMIKGASRKAHVPLVGAIKLVSKKKGGGAKSTFQPYAIPKLSKPSTLTTTKTAERDKTWNLRCHDGVGCRVIAVLGSEVSIRLCEMEPGMKIPAVSGETTRQVFASSQAATAFALSSVLSAADEGYVEGVCPQCSGPGPFTEEQLSEMVGMCRKGTMDLGMEKGSDALCRTCAKMIETKDNFIGGD